jgi:hypothetical protein
MVLILWRIPRLTCLIAMVAVDEATAPTLKLNGHVFVPWYRDVGDRLYASSKQRLWNLVESSSLPTTAPPGQPLTLLWPPVYRLFDAQQSDMCFVYISRAF